MVGLKIYVEGGGNTSVLKKELRRGFSRLFQNAGFAGNIPRFIACGRRQEAHKDFCRAVENGQNAMLLVDSEQGISSRHQSGNASEWEPWQHLAALPDNYPWKPPVQARKTDCHLMVQCMEAWFLADPAALEKIWTQSFRSIAPPSADIEGIEKQKIYDLLKAATRSNRKGTTYGKGKHAFRLLAHIDLHKVTAASGWARRFVDEARHRGTATALPGH